MPTFFSRNLLLGLAIGVVAGALGAKYYSEHKEEIDAKLKELKGLAGGESATDDAAMSLEELETQKERLEDLIAELKAKK